MHRLLAALLVSSLALAGCLSTAEEPVAETAEAPVPTAGPTANLAYAHDGTGDWVAPGDLGLVPPVFSHHAAGSGAEPTLGITSNGYVFVVANEIMMRSTDGGATWENVNGPLALPTTLDPLMHVDTASDRVYMNQLYLGCSYLSWTDDYGATWITNPAACGVPVNDHQTIATGKHVTTPTIPTGNVLYYGFNQLVDTKVSVSLDGGLTFFTNTAINDGCGGLNGHIVTGPQGEAYVPKGDPCGGTLRVGVSLDNGLTWNAYEVSDKVGYNPPGDDPALAVDAAGNVYVAWVGEDALPYMSASRDQGKTWTEPVRIGPEAVTSTLFPTAVAGDEGRVAFAYYGTTASPDAWESKFSADATEDTVWHVYVTFATDALADAPTFLTIQATDDPIQRGSIWNGGGGRPDRNLLDFFDIQKDIEGRVYVSYTDGCVGCENADTSRDREVVVAILQQGPSLSAAAGAHQEPPLAAREAAGSR